MNFLDILKQDLRAHEYIKARGLSKQVKFKGEIEPHKDCPVCRKAEMLPAVINVIERWQS